MKLRLSSSGCETRPAKGEPARAGSAGWFPRSLSNRSTGSASSYAPAASPWLRRRLSPWPPGRRHNPTEVFPTPMSVSTRCCAAPIRQVRAAGQLEGRSSAWLMSASWRSRSATQSRFGRSAVKLRFTRSRGRSARSSGIVVLHFRPRTTPRRPISAIRRSTARRATVTPSRIICRQTFRAPYTPKLFLQTRSIASRSAASRTARFDRLAGSHARALCS